MPKQPRASQKTGNGGSEKEWRRICNEGPRSGESETQAEACLTYVLNGGYRDMSSASLDELMPVFKMCAVGGPNECKVLFRSLRNTGHWDYALAIAEYAPNCSGVYTIAPDRIGCITLRNFIKTSDGYSISASDTRFSAPQMATP